MNQHYIFNDKHDYYTATASDIGGSAAKYTITSRFTKVGDPVTTTLRSPRGNQGIIHWNDLEIEINGVRHHIEDIRKADSGQRCVASPVVHPVPSLILNILISSLSHRWVLQEKQWQSEYMFDSKSWKVL